MAKYNVVELRVKGGRLIDLEQKSEAEKKALRNQNAIYVYRGPNLRKCM